MITKAKPRFIRKKINKLLLTSIVIYIAIFSQSCSTKRCLLCELDNRTVYHISLTDEGSEIAGSKQIVSYFQPMPIQAANNKVNLYVVDCKGEEPYRLDKGKDLELFVKENLLLIDSSNVRLISKTSDADFYPDVLTTRMLMEKNDNDPDFELCGRVRNPLKLELRGMVGFRSFEPSFYQPITGDVPIEKPTIGFGPEGSKITFGPEMAILPSVLQVKNKHRLNIGILTGYWPVDGGHFIPLAIHPRFTFNDITNPLWGSCNAYYLFGDLGTAYDLTGDFDKFWSNKLNAIFWDLGAGVDFWKSKKMDISVDFGYRQTTLPLLSPGENSEWLNCLSVNRIAYSDYPRRRTGQFFIRFGVTF